MTVCSNCGHGKELELNMDYDIPYTGGVSQDGCTIYLDKRLPESFVDSRKQTVMVYQYLIIHEVVEQALMNELKLDFNTAHSIAMGAELYAVTMDGINYDEYYGFIQKYVEFDKKPEDIHSVPPDLDLRPYEADHMRDVLDRIKELQQS